MAALPSSTSGISMRPLIVSLGQIRVSIPVSTSTDEWISAEILRDEFVHEQSLVDAIDTTADLENEAEAAVELAARFLGFVAQKLHQLTESTAARTSLLLNVFKYFTSAYLHTKEIHCLVASYDTEVRKTVLSSYFLALAALRENKVDDIPSGPHSALLAAVAAKKASVFALFGGQGTNEVYFDELQSLYDIYKPFVSSFLATVTNDALIPLAEAQNASSHYTFGLDVVSWLSGASPRPSTTYLASVPVSFPLIGLTQLVQYFVACNVAGLTPGQYRDTIADSVEGGEGMPTPMLSVLDSSLLSLRLISRDQHASSLRTSRLSVSLHNGPRAFVVTGPRAFPLWPVTHLRKVRARAAWIKARRPSSQRKPSFPPISRGAAEKLIAEDLGGQSCGKTEELKIPVVYTEDGTDLRQLSTSITQSLCEQIFTKPIHCGLGAHREELDGRGVRVIVVGDRAKGDPELYNAERVRYEEWWSKNMPLDCSDGTLYLDTHFSRLLGKPPIMVAGMTPSTVQAGLPCWWWSLHAAALRTKIAEIQSKIPAGVGITLNALYINQRQFGFQLPLWQEMRKEGLPIEGFCVRRRYPQHREGGRDHRRTEDAGIRHVAFKPGSVEGIRQVVNIRRSQPRLPTSSSSGLAVRAGGHHSYEDFHQPVSCRPTAPIRQQSNISLVGGSGFGAAEDVWPTKLQPMPFDGFLFASRVMVAKEAHTSSSVKDLIVAAGWCGGRGVEGTYAKPTGGILTVKSESGSRSTRFATRGVKLWKEFDDTVFKLPKEKRVAWLVERRDEVIGKLNKDFSKPWFGWKEGRERWVDVSLRNLTGTGLRDGGDKAVPPASTTPRWMTPLPVIESFLKAYPIATRQLLAAEDSAKDIEAVSDQDPQAHSKVKDEPIKDLLGNINSALIQPRGSARCPQRQTSEANGEVVYEVWNGSPRHFPLADTLAGSNLTWLRALVHFTTIVQGTSYIDNPISRLLAPRPGQKVVVGYDGSSPSSVTVYGAARSYGEHKPAFKAVEIKFTPTSKLIDITMFEDRRDVSVPLTLQFEYNLRSVSLQSTRSRQGATRASRSFIGSCGTATTLFSPISTSRETFHGPEVTIEASAVEQFWESFKTVRNDQVRARPWIRHCYWGAIMKSIFPSSIDGDLLKLVHLSNGFRMVDGAKPLQAGDVCKAEANIVSVTNTDAGKVVRVKGHVFRAGKPVIEVISAFLYQQHRDYRGARYIVTLETDAAVGVLQSKGWFEWVDESKPLLAGTSLIFRVKRSFWVGSVDFHQEDSRGNPVVAYIQRHGIPQGLSTPLANEGYTLTSGTTVCNAPLTNEPAATRRYVENVVAKGSSRPYNVSFLNVKIRHVGMRDEKVLEGSAEVSQPTTVYVFITGQGSQEAGMGMDLYNSSPAARAVVGQRRCHLLAVYGFSIEKTVHFGGIKGQAIRRRYMDMTYDTTMDKDGNVKTLPLFADIDVAPPSTRSATPPVSCATQFASKSRLLRTVPSPATFSESTPLLRPLLTFWPFRPWFTVVRDSENRSNYAMCAVNPSRISKTFTDAALREVVDSIATSTGTLLEIVNYNVEVSRQQYVCAGELVALQTMTNVLNFLKVQKIDIAKQKAEGHIKLERGFATIPLPGIDVPFHSRYLWAGVMPFRAYQRRESEPRHVIGKYIPNLIAIPFAVTKEYAQIIYDQTSSPRLDKVLKKWDQERWASDEQRQKLAYIILVELLAYQFASPVRWIQTQDRLFTEYAFERLIELGPSPTLTGMATRTLKAKYETQEDSISRTRTILCHAKNVKEIYYQFEDELDAPSALRPSAPAPAAAAAAPVVVAAPSGPAKRVDEVPLSKSIKDLVGGKSTLQNEILGDLQLEFSSAPEKGEELPLEELGGALASGFGRRTWEIYHRFGMPGGFNSSAIKTYLSKSWGLGSGRADGVLLLATTMEPAKRLATEAEAKSWLDGIVAIYAQRSGISLSSGSSSGGGGAAGGATINSEEFIKFQSEQQKFAAQHVELYMRYLNRDSRAGESALDQEKANSLALQMKLDNIAKEHGDVYIEGIQPMFDPLKARHFDSSWNWVRQDALLMYYDIIFGRLTTVDRDITARCIALMNRADPEVLAYMQYNIDHCDPNKGDNYKLAKQFGQQLIDNTREALGQPPVYKDVTFPTAPHTEVTAKGDIIYSEVVRENVRKLEAYVEEMASGDTVSGAVNINKVQEDVLKLWTVVKSQPGISQEQKNRIKALYEGVVRSLRKGPEPPRPRAGSRQRRPSSQFLRPQLPAATSVSADKVPLLHLKRKVGANWEYSSNLTGVYLDILHEIATSGTTFKDKNALLTGVGNGSIGVEIVKGLLSGGAHVVITTSRYSRSTVEYYQSIFQTFGSGGSALTVVPFNQGSKQDVEALVDYIYANLGLDLDYIIPSPACQRTVVRLTAWTTNQNSLTASSVISSPVPPKSFFPLSPNHGLFGNDGLYSESKISLETLFQRWSSESWGEYLCLAGAVIGWTRGTGLMGPTNIVAHELESYGVRTFSAKEMAITQVEPIWADLNGGMDKLPDLADINGPHSELRRAITLDNSADFKIVSGVEAERLLQTVNVTPRANFRFDFPTLEAYESLADLSSLQGMVDLEKVMVITGFGEVGPWGSSRTRWEMEARGEFTIEGCIEMAWIMGYIKHFDGRLKDGSLYVGWVDSKTGEPVDDKDVKGRYQKDILEHAGVRLIEPELFRGYDPKKKVFNQEIELIHDLEAIEVAESEAHKFKLQHGDKCD
ncbi:fatty acid synthase, partial [Mycena olivaceomarginata]